MDRRKTRGGTSRSWLFDLYVNGGDQESRQVERRLRQLCEKYLSVKYEITIVDIQLEEVLPHDLLTVPTIIRRHPLPEKKVVGNLTSNEKAVLGLGLDQDGIEQ